MKTDDLLKTLAADTAPERPLQATLIYGLVPALALAAFAVWQFLGVRADLAQSLFDPLSVARFILTSALGLVGLRLALLLARPDGAQRARLWPLAALGLVTLAVVTWAYVNTPADARQMAFVGKTISTCLVAIPLLSLLPVTAILVTLRNGATTAPRLASGIAGLAGGGVSAAVYALHCTEDSPLFYVTWYGLAIAIVTLGTWLIGPRLLRW